jgi:hypothetical protein
MTIHFAHLDEMMQIVPDDDCACDDCACDDCACVTKCAPAEPADRELAGTIWIERGTGWAPVTLSPRALMRRAENVDAGR